MLYEKMSGMKIDGSRQDFVLLIEKNILHETFCVCHLLRWRPEIRSTQQDSTLP